MSKWAAIAKTHFLQKAGEGTPKTPETQLMGVMGVVPRHLSKNEGGVLGVLGVGVPPIYKNEPFDDASVLARLIEAAMRACDHHDDGDAGREQMRQDCLATQPHLRKDLLVHLRTATSVGDRRKGEKGVSQAKPFAGEGG